jgi:hypothetical protein
MNYVRKVEEAPGVWSAGSIEKQLVVIYINYISRFIGIGTHEIPESEKKETIKPCV